MPCQLFEVTAFEEAMAENKFLTSWQFSFRLRGRFTSRGNCLQSLGVFEGFATTSTIGQLPRGKAAVLERASLAEPELERLLAAQARARPFLQKLA